jgi:uncharacterized protein
LSNRKKRRKSFLKKQPPTFYINIGVVLFFLALIAVLTNIFFFQDTAQERSDKASQIVKKSDGVLSQKYEEKTEALEIVYTDDEIEVAKKEEKKEIQKEEKIFSFIEDNISKPKIETKKEIIEKDTQNKVKTQEKESLKKEPQKEITKDKIQSEKQKEEKKQTTQKQQQYKVDDKEEEGDTKKSFIGKPKLAIIIDDITTEEQARKIANIGFPITMAFLPPTKRFKNSAKVADGIPFFMVHLPLEATTREHEEAATLHVGDDLEKIEARIVQIKQIFPRAKYINNHTGSKFTQDDASVDKLMQILKKYDFIFIDSRTTGKTAVKKYAKKYGMRYIGRNVFLDNTINKNYIKNQLVEAIRIAKKTGSAIAIGHPHRETFEALRESKHLLSDIDVVMANQI